jgi:hypothetical protein
MSNINLGIQEVEMDLITTLLPKESREGKRAMGNLKYRLETLILIKESPLAIQCNNNKNSY